MRHYTTAVLVATLLASPVLVGATVYTVSPDGLGDFPTIQAAVDSAGTGDIIELTDGVFTGDGNRDIVISANGVVLQSQGGVPMSCIIDCQGSARDEHRAFHFTSDGGAYATLADIGIMNGYVSGSGGGIWVEGASPLILNCVVGMCVAGAGSRGGGLYVSDGASPLVTQCVFAANSAGYGGGIGIWNSTGTYQETIINDNEAALIGGGIYAQLGGYTLVDLCEITSNSSDRAGGVRWMGSGSPVISHSVIARNEATGSSGGVWLQSGEITGCTIVENSAGSDGGGVYCASGTGAISASIVAFSEDGEGIAADDDDVPTIMCCDVFGNADGEYDASIGDLTGTDGNFSQNPAFCGTETGDYRLFETSPCLPGGNSCGVRVGALGPGCDSPVEESSWGSIKALWQ